MSPANKRLTCICTLRNYSTYKILISDINYTQCEFESLTRHYTQQIVITCGAAILTNKLLKVAIILGEIYN